MLKLPLSLALEELRAFFYAPDAGTSDAKTLDIIDLKATNFINMDRCVTRELFHDFDCIDGVCIEADAVAEGSMEIGVNPAYIHHPSFNDFLNYVETLNLS